MGSCGVSRRYCTGGPLVNPPGCYLSWRETAGVLSTPAVSRSAVGQYLARSVTNLGPIDPSPVRLSKPFAVVSVIGREAQFPVASQ